MHPESPAPTALDVESFREPQRAFHHVEVPAIAPSPWPTAEVELAVRIVGAGREITLGEFVTRTSTTSLLVVVDGVLVHERYAAGISASDRLLGNSATKSALATLVGVAVGRGDIPDLDARACEFVPELEESGYHDVTVRQLLTMTSGLDWAEDYHDPESRASKLIGRWRDGAGGMRELLATMPGAEPPGSRFVYCSPDTQVLDWVRERATGQTYAEAIADLWARVGAEHPAVVGLDAPADAGGVAVAAAALGASARDWARIGALQIDGHWNGEQILDPGWVDASSRPEKAFLAPGRLPSTITTHAGFGYHWWPLDERGDRVTGDGMRGQFVYVDRPLRTVVVKTSAWPYDDPWWDRQCRDLCYLALPAIAAAAVAAA
jgi:CubicO group peptidase (beta-lactamase class C family)